MPVNRGPVIPPCTGLVGGDAHPAELGLRVIMEQSRHVGALGTGPASLPAIWKPQTIERTHGAYAFGGG